jgi:hypothetical protein
MVTSPAATRPPVPADWMNGSATSVSSGPTAMPPARQRAGSQLRQDAQAHGRARAPGLPGPGVILEQPRGLALVRAGDS